MMAALFAISVNWTISYIGFARSITFAGGGISIVTYASYDNPSWRKYLRESGTLGWSAEYVGYSPESIYWKPLSAAPGIKVTQAMFKLIIGLYPGYGVHDYYFPLSWLVGLSVVMTALLFWRDRRTEKPGHCTKCGYNLTSNTTGVCPECGVVVAAGGGAAR